MNAQAIVAPQYGVWCSMAPATDNPAAQVPRMPADIRVRLRVLRDEARRTAVARVLAAPEVWRL